VRSPGPAAAVLGARALNRAFLARQLLLERHALSPEAAIEHLVGMQAQEPQAPYVGLWARLKDFQPDQLSNLIQERRAVRIAMMRTTIHLVTADDCARLWPLMRAVHARNFKGSSFSKAIAGVDLDELLAAGRELIVAAPRTRAELGSLLAERWHGVDPSSLAYAVSYLTPVVQVPPRGLWRRNGPARWAAANAWLERQLEEPSPDELVLRYLRAFGPATVGDLQAWSGLSRLREVADRLADRLRAFEDEQGRELLDVRDGQLPDPATPAPARFLPPFDNAILAHADRARIIPPEHRGAVSGDRLMRTFVVDGFVAGTWRLDGGTIHLTPFRPLRTAEREDLVTEAERLIAFAAPDATERAVRFARA